MVANKLAWVKNGGWDQSNLITYTAGEFQIIRTRIGGEWSMYTLYHNDCFVKGFKLLADAKAHAETM